MYFMAYNSSSCIEQANMGPVSYPKNITFINAPQLSALFGEQY